MAKAVIFSENYGRARKFDEANDFDSKIEFSKRRTKISGEITKLRRLQEKYFPILRISNLKRITKVEETLPFRVRFINIGIESYGPDNPPPIGIQVIGFNNYIL